MRKASRAQLIESYWTAHPRFHFFKGLPIDAKLLDVGVGTGGLPYWRGWHSPDRSDVKFYGIDLVVPPTRDMYEDFKVADLDSGIPYGDAGFDAAIASHVLEHVTSIEATLGEIARCLRAGARAYVEMPAPSTKSLPSAAEYRDAGWPMMISNFHDDGTHRETVALDALVAMGEACGLGCLQRGVVSVPYVEQALMAQGCAWNDAEVLLYGYWSSTRWAQYAVFEKA